MRSPSFQSTLFSVNWQLRILSVEMMPLSGRYDTVMSKGAMSCRRPFGACRCRATTSLL